MCKNSVLHTQSLVFQIWYLEEWIFMYIERELHVLSFWANVDHAKFLGIIILLYWVTSPHYLIILYTQMYWHLLQRLCATFHQREPQAKRKWANQRTSLQLLCYNTMYSPDRQEIVLREKETRILIKYWEKLIQELQMFVSYQKEVKTL